MNEKIDKLQNAWLEQVESRNSYKFATSEVCLDTFADLVKDTFEIIKYVKNQYLYASAYPEDPYDTVSYLQLLCALSQYSTYDYDGDESDDLKFTATCLVAQKLVEYAIYHSGSTNTGGTLKFFDTEDALSGKLCFFRDDYPFFSDEFSTETYHYEVYKGDFTEVLRLAKELA